jgi:beta-galactosidase
VIPLIHISPVLITLIAHCLQIHYEGGGSATAATDVICPMYARVHQVLKLADTPDEHRPVILCEYAHSMGNSTGNVAEYWAAFNAHPHAQGGFVWDWMDQALVKKAVLPESGKEIEYWAYGGDFGDVPNDAQFVCNGVVFPDRSPHPAAWEMKAVQSPLGVELNIISAEGASELDDAELSVDITNRNSFTSTSGWALEWRLSRFGPC